MQLFLTVLFCCSSTSVSATTVLCVCVCVCVLCTSSKECGLLRLLWGKKHKSLVLQLRADFTACLKPATACDSCCNYDSLCPFWYEFVDLCVIRRTVLLWMSAGSLMIKLLGFVVVQCLKISTASTLQNALSWRPLAKNTHCSRLLCWRRGCAPLLSHSRPRRPYGGTL